MSNILFEVPYLENADFDSNGNMLPYVNQGKPAVVMVQSPSCGHCTHAKPAFQELSDRYANRFAVLTIEAGPDTSELISRLYPDLVGYPTYYLYNSNGTLAGTHDGQRDVGSLVSSLSRLS